MNRRSGHLLLAALLALTWADSAPAHAPRPDVRRVDLYGDPLPAGTLVRMGTVRLHHANQILALAFLPDGKTLVTGSEDRTVRLWDATTGQELRRLDDFRGPVEGLAVTAEGNLLAVACGDGDTCVRLFDLGDGKELRRFDAPKGVYHFPGVALSPDGKTLATTGDDQTIRLWDVATGKPRTLRHEDAGRHDLLLVDGKYLMTGSWTGEQRLWDVSTGRPPAWFAKQAVWHGSAVFTPDGKSLVVAAGRAVRWWNLAAGKEVSRSRWPETLIPDASARPAFPVRPAPERGHPRRRRPRLPFRHVRAGRPPARPARPRRRGSLPRATGEELMTFTPPLRFAHLGLQPGRQTPCRGRPGGRRPRAGPGQARAAAERGHVGPVGGVAFLLDGKVLATGGATTPSACGTRPPARNSPTRRHGTVHRFLRGGAGRPDARAGPARVAIALCDAATGKELRRFAYPDGVDRLAFAPDGKSLAVATGDRVRLLDAATGAGRVGPMKHPGLDPLPRLRGRKTLAVGIRGGSILFWETASGKSLRMIAKEVGTAASLAFSPDGTVLAAGYGDRRIRLWDPATGEELRELPGHDGWVNALAFSPDGTRLTSASSDRRILVWDLATFRPVQEFREHQSEVMALAYSPDGKHLASGSHDTTALIWDAGK